MNVTAIIINVIAVIGLLITFAKDGKKAIKSLKVAGKSFIRMLPMVFVILIIIGLLLGFVPPDQISRFVGEQSGMTGILFVGAVGAVLHIPALLSKKRDDTRLDLVRDNFDNRRSSSINFSR